MSGPGFRSNQDLFDFLIGLADHARAVGDVATAKAVDDCLRSGFSASERLGGIRSTLATLRRSIDERYPPDLRARVDLAVAEIDKAFDRANGAL